MPASIGPDFFGGSLRVINLHHVPLLPKPYLPYTHIQLPTRWQMPRLALPLLAIINHFITEWIALKLNILTDIKIRFKKKLTLSQSASHGPVDWPSTIIATAL
jgi:hypothetical protein